MQWFINILLPLLPLLPIIGGIAGLSSAIWTIFWNYTQKPRVRWELTDYIARWNGKTYALTVTVVNVGTATASLAYARVTKPKEPRTYTQPDDNKRRVEPGGTFMVTLLDMPEDTQPFGAMTGLSGEAVHVDPTGYFIEVRWLRPIAKGYKKQRFDIAKYKDELYCHGIERPYFSELENKGATK